MTHEAAQHWLEECFGDNAVVLRYDEYGKPWFRVTLSRLPENLRKGQLPEYFTSVMNDYGVATRLTSRGHPPMDGAPELDISSPYYVSQNFIARSRSYLQPHKRKNPSGEKMEAFAQLDESIPPQGYRKVGFRYLWIDADALESSWQGADHFFQTRGEVALVKSKDSFGQPIWVPTEADTSEHPEKARLDSFFGSSGRGQTPDTRVGGEVVTYTEFLRRRTARSPRQKN